MYNNFSIGNHSKQIAFNNEFLENRKDHRIEIYKEDGNKLTQKILVTISFFYRNAVNVSII